MCTDYWVSSEKTMNWKGCRMAYLKRLLKHILDKLRNSSLKICNSWKKLWWWVVPYLLKSLRLKTHNSMFRNKRCYLLKQWCVELMHDVACLHQKNSPYYLEMYWEIEFMLKYWFNHSTGCFPFLFYKSQKISFQYLFNRQDLMSTVLKQSVKMYKMMLNLYSRSNHKQSSRNST